MNLNTNTDIKYWSKSSYPGNWTFHMLYIGNWRQQMSQTNSKEYYCKHKFLVSNSVLLG